MKLDNIELPETLYWQNEFDWQPAAQSTERSVTGGLVVEAQALQYGQPITLTGGWVSRADLTALLQLLAQPDQKRVLELNDGSQHSVLFDLSQGGIKAPLLMPEHSPTGETLYQITLYFLTVEP